MWVLCVQLDPRIGNSRSQSRAKGLTEVGFLPHPYRHSPPAPASPRPLRLVRSWAPGRLQQAFSTTGRTAHPLVPWSPLNPSAAETAGPFTQPCVGKRGSQGSMRQPALSSFSNSSRLLPPPASGGARLLVLTFYSRRQLRDGGERGVGEKGQALADGGGSDFPHKLPSPPCLYDALLGLNKQRLLTQR